MSGRYPPLRAHRPELPGEVEALVASMLVPNPNRRPATELLRALDSR